MILACWKACGTFLFRAVWILVLASRTVPRCINKSKFKKMYGRPILSVFWCWWCWCSVYCLLLCLALEHPFLVNGWSYMPDICVYVVACWLFCLPCSWVSQPQIVYVVDGDLLQNSDIDLWAWLFGIAWPRFLHYSPDVLVCPGRVLCHHIHLLLWISYVCVDIVQVIIVIEFLYEK